MTHLVTALAVVAVCSWNGLKVVFQVDVVGLLDRAQMLLEALLVLLPVLPPVLVLLLLGLLLLLTVVLAILLSRISSRPHVHRVSTLGIAV